MAPKRAPAQKATEQKEKAKVYDYSGLEKGTKLQIEFEGAWYSGEVVEVSKAKNSSRAPVKVAYRGHSGCDEWVGGDRLRSKAIKEKAKEETKKAVVGQEAKAKVYDYSGLEKGTKLQIESEGAWYSGEVVQVSDAKNRSKAPVKVSYIGYAGYDEWLGGDRLRSKAIKEKVKPEGKKVYDYSGLEKGMKLQIESEGAWYSGEVVQVSDAKSRAKAPVNVSYIGYSGYDEWLGGDRLKSKAIKMKAK